MMRTVEIRRRSGAGDVEVIARVSVQGPGEAAVIEPMGAATLAMVDDLLASVGVVGRRGDVIHPVDGEAYLRALLASLRGSRLWAEETGSV